jgi:hypothetical protein
VPTVQRPSLPATQSAQAKCPASSGMGVQLAPESVSTFVRNGCPAWPGIRSQAMRQAQNLRKRCSECGRWFRPSARSAHHQKTCGRRECRRRRRARLERRQRWRSPQDSRVAERERQRASRQRRSLERLQSAKAALNEAAAAQCGSVGPGALSLAGFSAEVSDIIDEIRKKLDMISQTPGALSPPAAALSLAGLRLELVEIADEIGQKLGQELGQVGQKSAAVTGRLDSETCRNDDRNHPQSGTRCHWPAMTGASP